MYVVSCMIVSSPDLLPAPSKNEKKNGGGGSRIWAQDYMYNCMDFFFVG